MHRELDASNPRRRGNGRIPYKRFIARVVGRSWHGKDCVVTPRVVAEGTTIVAFDIVGEPSFFELGNILNVLLDFESGLEAKVPAIVSVSLIHGSMSSTSRDLA